MSFLLKLSRLIDAFSNMIGKLVMWFILATTLISAGNAIVRKLFDSSSNALLEIQWYLFAAVFMLGSGYAFLRNAHVRIDFISSKFSARGRNWVDVAGILIFLFPLCYMMATLGWPLFERAWVTGEMSSNSGGLIRWPVYGLIPLGFAILFLQGVSELIKRLAFLTGNGPDVLAHEGPSDEELLAQQLLEEAEQRLKEEAAQRLKGAN
ncbi:MAG: TRAP transporter small permease subunit [Comamonadaceae bacterium]|nr:MAG: TRAP transporter small permease subunit [Comamonadaceae bacterium]